MKRAIGPSFLITLCLFCFLQEGVGAVDTRSHSVKYSERAQYIHDHGTATRSSRNNVQENGRHHEESEVRVDSANHEQLHTRSGEKRTAPKLEVTSHTTKAATNVKERNNWEDSHGRTSGNGAAVDDWSARTYNDPRDGETQERTHSDAHPPPPRNSNVAADDWSERTYSHETTTNERTYSGADDRTERTHSHYTDGDAEERAHSGVHPPPPRTSDAVEREEGNAYARDSTTTTTSHSRTHYGGDTGEERINANKHPATKTSSSHHSTEERTGGEEEETVVEAKTEAHPIGLINGLDGKAAMGRSIELDAREMDTTTTILASALIGFTVLLLLLFCIAEIAKKRREKKADSTRLLRVFQYLHEFNVDDIDIQLSAAGGFHVGYLNGLAQGINTKKQADQKTDTSSDEGENGGNLSKKV
ncbi:unnamed protein product [Cylindrotheca closterium]|uniref:Uncharacterized protein n=1 Tax=Cylindrotheca closterium TaxID=2856 RepID=A0AAD2GCW6_9STRA|nr:unnamed protein product [Cylindrotheca closterium]